MTRLGKMALAAKSMTSFRKLFMSKTAVTSAIAVGIENLKNSLEQFTETKKTEALQITKDYTDSVKSNLDGTITGINATVAELEQRITDNTGQIHNLANLGTFCGSVSTYAALLEIDKDLYGDNITNGDSAELSVRDGDKAPGLYRVVENKWDTVPFINYELANAVDEPVSQADIDEAMGVA